MLNQSTTLASVVSQPASFFTNNQITCYNNTWIAPNLTYSIIVNGTWNFSIYSNCTAHFTVAQYFLFAKILKLNYTGLFNPINTSNVGFDCNTGAALLRSWTYNVPYSSMVNLSSGDRIGIQICTEVTGGGGGGRSGTIFWENTTNSTVIIPTNTLVPPPNINFTSSSDISGSFVGRNYILANVTASSLVLKNITISLYNSSFSLVNATNSSVSPLYINFTGLSAGLYYLNATAYDTLGDLNYTETRNITVDLDKPIITVNSPINKTYDNTQILINFSATDTSPISSLWFYNGSSNITYTSPAFVNLSETNYTFIFYANDSAGNVNSTSVTFNISATPLMNAISIFPNPIAGGNLITINVSAYQGTNDTLQLFCTELLNAPVAANSFCTGGNTLQNPPYNLTCTYSTVQDNTNHTVYCRLYDTLNGFYSTVQNVTYTTQSTAPTTTLISIAGSTGPNYYDTVNAAAIPILVSGQIGMSCKWSSSNVAYSSMSNQCTMNGNIANCSVNDVPSQGYYTQYVSCQSSLGVGQTSANNIVASFYLDYTAPSTTDTSVSSLQLPGYSITINSTDVVDGDPQNYYCVSTVQGCNPTNPIANEGQIVFNTKGTNYLEYYSVDFVGNTETTINKTINISI